MTLSWQDRRRSRRLAHGSGPEPGFDRGRDSVPTSALRIDRIVVEGLASTDGEAFVRALDRELTSRFQDRSAGFDRSAAVDRIDAGEVRVAGGDRAAAVAERLAVRLVEEADG